MVAIGEVCTLMTGGTPKTTEKEFYENGDVPWIVSGDIHKGEIYGCESKITKLAVEKSNARYLPKDSVLIALNGQGKTRGTVALLRMDGATCNQSIVSINPNNLEQLSAEYLFYYLKSQYQQIRNITGDKDRAGLNMPLIRGIKIPLPPLAEQKRIAAILDKADAIRRKRQQAIQLADDFLRAVFLEMFGDPVTNPKGWEVKKFGDVIDVLTDYHANGSYKTLVSNVTLLDEPDYAYMVRTTDLEKGNFTDSVKYIDQHAYEHLSKSKVFGGEIIINKIGSAGAVYLMPFLNKPVSLAMNQFLVRCNRLALNEFMYYQLKTDSGNREILKRVQGAVTKTITKDAVRDIPIILPPLESQQNFVEVANKIKRLKCRIHDSFELTESKFNSLSQRAFSGQL
ncbi:restriction modification system S chain-like protein [Shewanella xiamenensis]|nr:restriction modification system S chain-like protein [Shewanella xiamenensis]GLD78959.1 restriction modification system S chain-like protein [Shewanella xiamenensis]